MADKTYLSVEQAYRAMLRFLEDHYERTRSDEIGALLGGLAYSREGHTMDPAAWDDWLRAVAAATNPRP